jgi:hypothetical protein
MKQTGLKFQADRMVREHRRSFNPQSAIRNPQFSYRAPWYRAIDWEVFSKYLCMITLGLCLLYLGIFMFVPAIVNGVGQK